jgi:hypothetical protein
LIAGDETSKNNKRTSNKNMNKEARARARRKKREVQFIGKVLIPVGNTNRD